MNEKKLAKQILSPDWIDLSYGEPFVVTKACHDVLNLEGTFDKFPKVNDTKSFTYQPAQGYLPLVQFLEKQYAAKVVITNGARQGISAVAYALKKLGQTEIVSEYPRWISTADLITAEGLACPSTPSHQGSSIIITSPNNPDGREDDVSKISEHNLRQQYKFIIHDAAYYTPVYTMMGSAVERFGDAQIFSYAKMYGLSGLRVGYVVCYNADLASYVEEYVEMMTSGVSIMSQMAIYEIEKLFDKRYDLKHVFQDTARNTIIANRFMLMNGIRKDVLETMPCKSNSMFAWCKVGSKVDWQAAKVFAVNGSLFGDPSMVRLNIAVEPNTLQEAIRRLNGAAPMDES